MPTDPSELAAKKAKKEAKSAKKEKGPRKGGFRDTLMVLKRSPKGKQGSMTVPFYQGTEPPAGGRFTSCILSSYIPATCQLAACCVACYASPAIAVVAARMELQKRKTCLTLWCFPAAPQLPTLPSLWSHTSW
jgi:hypothetical protein